MSKKTIEINSNAKVIIPKFIKVLEISAASKRELGNTLTINYCTINGIKIANTISDDYGVYLDSQVVTVNKHKIVTAPIRKNGKEKIEFIPKKVSFRRYYVSFDVLKAYDIVEIKKLKTVNIGLAHICIDKNGKLYNHKLELI